MSAKRKWSRSRTRILKPRLLLLHKTMDRNRFVNINYQKAFEITFLICYRPIWEKQDLCSMNIWNRTAPIFSLD